MVRYQLTLFRLSDSTEVNIGETTVTVQHAGSPEGEENLAIEIAAELQKALQSSDYDAEIPDATIDLTELASRKIDPTQWWDVRNTENLWLEISNTLADVRFLLAQSRAYKALEPPPDQQERREMQLRYYAHFAKMYHLNLAVFGLVKIQDLVVRLLFENFGGALIEVDQTDQDWERKLTMKDAKKGLRRRLDSGELPQAEYDQIVDALEKPAKSAHQESVVRYRNGIGHRIRPSVDYAELYTAMEDRLGKPILDSAGRVQGRQFAILARPSEPDFYFLDLYSALLDYLRFVIEMLEKVKSIPRFA